mgnify:CR=1 FL=1
MKKFVKEELRKLYVQINNEIEKIRTFSEAYLLVLLDLAMTNEPRERLIKVLSTVSVDFPQPILEIYVKRSVHRAKESKIEFEDFADCLIKGLGDKAKELRLVEEIAKVYGFRSGERWKEIVEGSGSSANPPQSQKMPIANAEPNNDR